MSDLFIYRFKRFVVAIPQHRDVKRRMYNILNKFEYIDYFQRKMIRKAKKFNGDAKINPVRWYGADESLRYLRVRNEDYQILKSWAETELIEIVEKEQIMPVIGKKVSIKLAKGWKPRDYQVEPIEWVAKDDDDKLLPFQPGDGKTFMSLAALAKIKRRVLFSIKPRYIDKWISDISEITTVPEDKVLVIRKTSDLREWLEAYSEEDQGHGIIIISNRLLGMYIKEYESGYFSGIPPSEIAEIFDAGILVIDEIHQDFNLNYRILLYLNVNKLIGMSGTFVSKDHTITKMMYRMFSKEQRAKIHRKKPHIDVVAVRYSFAQTMIPKDYAYTRNEAYNHIMLEQHFMRSPCLLHDYLEIILGCFESYIERREDEDKCLIYCSSVAMCYIVRDYIKYHYPDLLVTTKVQDDEYEVIMKNDVIVSTVMSSGTAFDIPKLITVIQTIALDSVQSNLQSLGRLRDLGNKPTEFLYLFSSDIPRQFAYHNSRYKTFQQMSKSYRVLGVKFNVGDSCTRYINTDKFEFVKFLVRFSRIKDLVKNGENMLKKYRKRLSMSKGQKRRYWAKKIEKLEYDIQEAKDSIEDYEIKSMTFFDSR